MHQEEVSKRNNNHLKMCVWVQSKIQTRSRAYQKRRRISRNSWSRCKKVDKLRQNLHKVQVPSRRQLMQLGSKFTLLPLVMSNKMEQVCLRANAGRSKRSYSKKSTAKLISLLKKQTFQTQPHLDLKKTSLMHSVLRITKLRLKSYYLRDKTNVSRLCHLRLHKNKKSQRKLQSRQLIQW